MQIVWKIAFRWEGAKKKILGPSGASSIDSKPWFSMRTRFPLALVLMCALVHQACGGWGCWRCTDRLAEYAQWRCSRTVSYTNHYGYTHCLSLNMFMHAYQHLNGECSLPYERIGKKSVNSDKSIQTTFSSVAFQSLSLRTISFCSFCP